MRRLGYDLSQARLEAIAASLGIEQTVASMTQAEKAQLRYYAVMTQVTNAQGDMARTLEQPANQLRILQSQITQAAQAFGSIFIPILNAALPYVIALAKVIRLLAASIASLFGFTLPEIDYSGVTEVGAEVGNLNDQLEEAGGSAKKLKSYLMGFDELNVIDSKDSGSGGGGSSGGVGGSDWEWDLPIYDFLDDAVTSRVTALMQKFKPLMDFLQTHLEEILAIVAAIGAEWLMWRLAKSLIPDLGTANTALKDLLKGITALATAVITVALVYEFDKKFLETGKYGYLVADGIATLLGAAIAGLVVGGTAGLYTASAVVAISALTSLSVFWQGVNEDGFDANDAALGAVSTIKLALAGALAGKALGASVLDGAFVGFSIGALVTSFITYQQAVTDPLIGTWDKAGRGLITAAMGAMTGTAVAKAFKFKNLGLAAGIGFTVTAAAEFLVNAVHEATEGEGFNAAAYSVATIATGALAGALVAVGIAGAAAAGIGFIVGGAITATISAIVVLDAVRKSRTAKFHADWGSIERSAEEIKADAAAMFDFAIDARIDLLNATLTNLKEAKASLNSQIEEFNAGLDMIYIGVDFNEETAKHLNDKLLGENGIIAGIQSALEASEELLKVSISVMPPKDAEGNELNPAEMISAMFSADKLISAGVEDIGKTMADLITKGATEGLSQSETELLTSLQNTLSNVTYALTQGNIASEFSTNVSFLLRDATKDSFIGITDEYAAYVEELGKAYQETAVAQQAEFESRIAALTALRNQYFEQGNTEMVAATDEAIALVQAQLDAFDPVASATAATESSVALGKAKMMATYFDVFADPLSSVFDDTRVVSDMLNEISEQIITSDFKVEELGVWLSNGIDAALKEATGKDYDAVLNMQEKLELTGWDLLTTDVQTQFYNSMTEAFGAEKAKEVFDSLGYSLTGVFASSLTSETSNTVLKAAGENMVSVVKDGVEVAQINQTEALKLIAEELGEETINGLLNGADTRMDEIIPLLSEIFGIPIDTAKDELEVHSPSKAFERIGGYIIDGLIAGLGGLALKMIAVWAVITLGSTTTVSTVKLTFSTISSYIADQFTTGFTDAKTEMTSFKDWIQPNFSVPVQEKITALTLYAITASYNLVTALKAEWLPVKDWFETNFFTPVKGKVTSLETSVKDSATNLIKDIKDKWLPVPEWFGENIAKPLKLVFSDLSTHMTSSLLSPLESFNSADWYNSGHNAAQKLRNGIMSVNMPKFSVSWSTSTRTGTNADGTTYTVSVPIPNISRYALGGFPKDGELFIAREAGPEMVGSIGRRTAVANNDQIVAGIANGVAEANGEQNALLREQNSLLRSILQKESGVYLDGRTLTNSVEKYQRERGRVVVTGGVV